MSEAVSTEEIGEALAVVVMALVEELSADSVEAQERLDGFSSRMLDKIRREGDSPVRHLLRVLTHTLVKTDIGTVPVKDG